MNIEQQKQLADKVYDMLTLIDPNCVLAGGAPRDWYLGTAANDLDFYFCSTGSTVKSVEKQLNRAGFKVKASICPVQSELYEYMPGLVRIWNCESEAMKVQFIQMSDQKYRWDVVSNMDVSICKAWYSHNGNIKLHQDFKLTVASGIMFLKDKYSWDNKHSLKMKKRFSGKFYAGTREQATSSLVSKVLMEI
ncbi:hypothetical protein D3C85_384840 [compost metagenome]